MSKPKKVYRVQILKGPDVKRYWAHYLRQGASGVYVQRAAAVAKIKQLRQQGFEAQLEESSTAWTVVDV